MYRISKRFDFSASHQLEGLPEGHPCGRLHGHNYSVELFLEASGLDKTGFVRDYGELSKFKTWLDGTFDHRHLNDIMDQPTAELLAHSIYEVTATWYPELSAVKVSETPKTSAYYSPEVLSIEDRVIAVFENLASEPGANREQLCNALETILAPHA